MNARYLQSWTELGFDQLGNEGLAGRSRSEINMSRTERIMSAIAGSALAAYGLTRRTPGGLALALAGGGLLYRGSTGHCDIYAAMDINRAEAGDDTRAALSGSRGVNGEEGASLSGLGL